MFDLVCDQWIWGVRVAKNTISDHVAASSKTLMIFFFFVLVFKEIHKHVFILKPNSHGMYGITKLSLSIQLCIWLRSGKGTVTTITPLVSLL